MLARSSRFDITALADLECRYSWKLVCQPAGARGKKKIDDGVYRRGSCARWTPIEITPAEIVARTL